jgi:hypothetical protein
MTAGIDSFTKKIGARPAGPPRSSPRLVVVVMVVMVVMMPANDADMMMVVMMMTDPDRNLGDLGLLIRLRLGEPGIVGL